LKSIVAFLLLINSGLYAQNLNLIKKVKLDYTVESSAIDSDGNLYLVSDQGIIYKYNQYGDSLLTFSPRKNAKITQIEAWRELKVFLFYHDFQEYTFLDRFLRPTAFYSFDPNYISYAGLATLGNGDNLWVLDPGEFALKRYNSMTNMTDLSTQLEVILPINDYDVFLIREHQNQLFVFDKSSGIYVFDNIGNYKKNIPLTDYQTPGFFLDKLFYLNKDGLNMTDIYTGATSIQPLPQGISSPGSIQIGSDKIYFIEQDLLSIFEFLQR